VGREPMTATPFDWVTESARPRLLGALSLLLVGSSSLLMYLDRALVSAEAPNGIVSFELAGSLAAAESILRSWSADARARAMLIQGFDYLYLLVYPAWFALAASLVGGALGGAWLRAGLATAWCVVAAAPLDAIENYALIQQLLHGASPLMARIALWCAVPKFVLVMLATIFVLLAGGRWVAGRWLERA
jgi:hypothetical protein